MMCRMKCCIGSLLMVWFATGLCASGSGGAYATPPTRPKVLVIGIDGCRHDAAVAADTPHVDAIIARGTRFEGTEILSPNRVDQANTVSGPGWSNLLTGVWPNKHGVTNNRFFGSQYDSYPHFFVRAKAAKPEIRTASFSDWGPIAQKILSASDKTVNQPAEGAESYARNDAELAEHCSEHLRNFDTDLVFLYLGQVDECGHTYGFHPTVKQYIQAIERVDGHIGQVVKAVESRKSYASEDWLTILCTDHGGAGTDHGDGHTNPDIRRTFLVVSGPSAEVNAPQVQTYQVDVVATALTHLKIPLHKDWELDGKPVGLKPASTTTPR
jgi:predicted AlkP superfamily pyrophosphatase or phosphodiesterase